MSKEECACRVVHIEYGETAIEYCHKHEAAPELYETCKLLLHEVEIHTTQWDRGMQKLSLEARAVIKKAMCEEHPNKTIGEMK